MREAATDRQKKTNVYNTYDNVQFDVWIQLCKVKCISIIMQTTMRTDTMRARLDGARRTRGHARVQAEGRYRIEAITGVKNTVVRQYFYFFETEKLDCWYSELKQIVGRGKKYTIIRILALDCQLSVSYRCLVIDSSDARA